MALLGLYLDPSSPEALLRVVYEAAVLAREESKREGTGSGEPSRAPADQSHSVICRRPPKGAPGAIPSFLGIA